MKVIANPKYSQYLCAWAQKKIDGARFGEGAQALGVFRNDKLAAVAVYNNFSKTKAGGNIFIHFAAETPRWATREAIRFFLSYPFRQLGCNRITATIAKSNKPSRKLVYGIGFKLEGVMRAAAPDGKDFCIYGLTKDEFESKLFEPLRKKLNGKDDGQGIERAAAA